jgi:hypothetical protein
MLAQGVKETLVSVPTFFCITAYLLQECENTQKKNIVCVWTMNHIDLCTMSAVYQRTNML